MSTIKKQVYSEKLLWVIILSYSILEIAVFMITPFIYKFFIDSVIEQKEIKYLFITIFLYFFSYVLVTLFDFLKQVNITKLSQKIISKVRNEYYIQLKKSKLTYLNNVKFGSEITLIVNEINDVIHQYVIGYTNVIVNVLRIVIGAIVLAVLDYKLLIILIVCLPLYIILSYGFKNKIGKNAKEYNKIRERYTNVIQDGIEGSEDIVIFNKQNWDIDNVRMESKKFIKNRIQSTMLLRAASDLSYVFYWGIICVIYFFGAKNIIAGNFTIGLMLVYVAYLDNIYSPSRILLSSFATLKNAKSLSNNFNVKMETMKEHKEFSYNNTYNVQEMDKVHYQDIHFMYNEGDFEVSIDNISLESGKKIGFIGESGSGKTTILKVLTGLYPFTEGTIVLDNNKVNSVDLQTYSSVCTQNPHLFNIELNKNIEFPDNIIKDKEYIDFVYVELGINEFNNLLPIELSGGQYHRIALARTFIKDAKLYVFDEPTASIDKNKRNSFYKIIDSLIERGKIIIVITHNIEELNGFDKIYRVHKGKINF